MIESQEYQTYLKAIQQYDNFMQEMMIIKKQLYKNVEDSAFLVANKFLQDNHITVGTQIILPKSHYFRVNGEVESFVVLDDKLLYDSTESLFMFEGDYLNNYSLNVRFLPGEYKTEINLSLIWNILDDTSNNL